MNRSSRVESCSRDADTRSRAEGGRLMSSVVAAQQITRTLADMIAPEMPGKVKIDRLYRVLTNRVPTMSRRRVRALFFAEAARIDYDEMRALEELRAEEELRHARRQFAASAIVLATHHAKVGETVARDELLEISRRHGALDLSRDGGDAR